MLQLDQEFPGFCAASAKFMDRKNGFAAIVRLGCCHSTAFPRKVMTMTFDYRPLRQIRLREGRFAEAQRVNREVLLRLDPDRLLAPFRQEAGLPLRLGSTVAGNRRDSTAIRQGTSCQRWPTPWPGTVTHVWRRCLEARCPDSGKCSRPPGQDTWAAYLKGCSSGTSSFRETLELPF